MKAKHKSELKDELRHAKYDIAADLARIKDAFVDTAQDVKGQTSEMIMNSLNNAKEKSTVMVQEKPFRSIGIAALVGGVIGYLLHR